MTAAYAIEPGANFQPLTEEEAELAETARADDGNRSHGGGRQWASLRGLAVQEFAEDPVSCFRASGECVFELEAVEQALAGRGRTVGGAGQPAAGDLVAGAAGAGVRDRSRSGGRRDRGRLLVRGSDRSARLGTQCAELHGHWPPRELARKLVELGKEYNTALLAVERNNHGHGVLACLRTLEYPTGVSCRTGRMGG